MTEFRLVQMEPRPAAVRWGLVPIDELPGFFGAAFAEVLSVVEAQGVGVAGEPFGYYPGRPSDRVEVAAGFPTSHTIEAVGAVVPLVLPGGPAVTAVHVGPYETMERTYEELLAWMAQRSLEPADRMWEHYLSDPQSEPDPANWRTVIVWPVRSAGGGHEP